MAAVKTKKVKVTRSHINEARAAKHKDPSPVWDGCDEWDSDTFLKKFHEAMKYYNLEKSAKDLKPIVLKWMAENEYTADDIARYKKAPDWQSSATAGAIASCLLRGMTPQRDDFNNGHCAITWMHARIKESLSSCVEEDLEVPVETKVATTQPSIQDRVKEVSLRMIDDLEDAVEMWITNPAGFNPKAINIVALLKGKLVKSAHARIIKDFYAPQLAEMTEVLGKEVDEDLKEGYSNRTKKQIQNFHAFLTDIHAACDMIMETDKVNRAPRIKKTVSADKIVARLKYLKTHDPLKLVSINPVSIIDAKELWVFDTKTKKLFKYVADELTGPLTVKGANIAGYDEIKSLGKTLRKPADQLTEFKKAGKVALRSFFEDIKTVEIKANGRINTNQILLKVQ